MEGQVPAQEMLRAQDLNHRKKMNPSEKASLSCHPSRTWSPVGYYWSLGKDTFQAQPKVQQSTSMQTAMTVCNYCPALIPGNRGISCTSLVHACVRRSNVKDILSWRLGHPSAWVNWDHISRVAMLQKYLETSNQIIIACVPMMYPIINIFSF